MDTLAQDLHYAVRSLFRQPSFALTAILTLALGIAASTAIFCVVYAVILRPLPFEEPARIVTIQNDRPQSGGRSLSVSAPDFHDWKARSGSFEAMGYYTLGELSATIGGSAEYVMAYRVSPGFFETFRARPTLGRLFSEQEQRPGGDLATVITDAFWRRQFNADPGAIGSELRFDDRTFTIVGVLGPEMRFPAEADFYYPAATEPETPRSAHNYRAVGRLQDGVTLEQARSEMTSIATRLAEMYPKSNEGKLVAIVPLHDVLVGSIEQTLWVLFGAVGVVLVIACANVANLLLARSSIRVREMVMRAALGASRARLIRQLLTESVVLGVAAALLGAWLARLGTVSLIALAPASIPRIADVQVDTTALGFALVVALLAAMIFGLAPALQVSRVQLVAGLRQGGKGSSIGGRTGVARSAFVVAEIALAVVLVTGAALLGRSLAAMTSVDMGFDPQQLLVLQTAVPVETIDDAPRAVAFYRNLLDDVRTLPGVASVSAVRSLPGRTFSQGAYGVEGGPNFSDPRGVVALPQALFNVVAPDYFRTLGVPLRRGRDFTDGDSRGAPLVAVVNESFVRAAFPDQDPLGRRIQAGLDTLEFMTVVGVVADIHSGGPTAAVQPEIFMPYQQHPGPAATLNVVARVETGDPLALGETIRRKVVRLNRDVPVRATTMQSTLATAAETPWFRTVLIVVFASVALVLALAGIYGLMTYTVTQRVAEFGVRIALGASPGNILRLILGQGALLAIVGLVLGIGLSLAAGRLLEGLLFGVTAREPWIFAAVSALVGLAALAACYLPGRRAVTVDPIVALRAE